MNISIELSPLIEQQLRDVAAQYQLDIYEFAPQAVQELLAHAVNWWPENQPNINALLDEIALEFRTQAVRSAQDENGSVVDVN